MTYLPSIPKELIDQSVIGPMSAEVVHATSLAFKRTGLRVPALPYVCKVRA